MKNAPTKDELPLAIDKNSRFKYDPGGNVMNTWRKYGWTPPTEYRTDYFFGTNREALNVNA